MPDDVPSPIDLQTLEDARDCERSALRARPWRIEFFEPFGSELSAHEPPVTRVLELGSVPGFLANHLLKLMPERSSFALDSSAAMHDLARPRLASYLDSVEFIEHSFTSDGCTDGLGEFDCVVTNQAVHELRHKSTALRSCGFLAVEEIESIDTLVVYRATTGIG